jgi:hypothetical protein
MSRKALTTIRRGGAYVVKSAESGASRVPSKTTDAVRPTPTSDDKQLVAALRRTKANS